MAEGQTNLQETVWSRAWRDLWVFKDRPRFQIVALLLNAAVAGAGAFFAPEGAMKIVIGVASFLLVPLIGGGLFFLLLLLFALAQQRDEARGRLLRLQESGLSEEDQQLVSEVGKLAEDLQTFLEAGQRKLVEDPEGFTKEYRDGLRSRVFWAAEHLFRGGLIHQETRERLSRVRGPYSAQYALVVISEMAKRMEMPSDT